MLNNKQVSEYSLTFSSSEKECPKFGILNKKFTGAHQKGQFAEFRKLPFNIFQFDITLPGDNN